MALCTLFYVEERVAMNHYEPHRAKNDHNMKMEPQGTKTTRSSWTKKHAFKKGCHGAERVATNQN